VNEQQRRLELELGLLELEAFAATFKAGGSLAAATGLAIKSAPSGVDYEIEGLGMPFGGPFAGKDLANEFFSPRTEFAFDWFGPGERPLLFRHGLDPDAGLSVIGRVKSWAKTDAGVWVQCQLDKSSKYWKALQQLIDAGKLFFSSGSVSHLVQTNKKTGEILTWPWTELSAVVDPCNPMATLQRATQAEKHFELAGLSGAWDRVASRAPLRSSEELARDLDLIELEAFAAGLPRVA